MFEFYRKKASKKFATFKKSSTFAPAIERDSNHPKG